MNVSSAGAEKKYPEAKKVSPMQRNHSLDSCNEVFKVENAAQTPNVPRTIAARVNMVTSSASLD